MTFDYEGRGLSACAGADAHKPLLIFDLDNN